MNSARITTQGELLQAPDAEDCRVRQRREAKKLGASAQAVALLSLRPQQRHSSAPSSAPRWLNVPTILVGQTARGLATSARYWRMAMLWVMSDPTEERATARSR